VLVPATERPPLLMKYIELAMIRDHLDALPHFPSTAWRDSN
jgi:hypothetical protein